MPEIANLTATELAEVLPPDEPALGPEDLAQALPLRIAHFDASIARLDRVAELYDALGRWIDRTPPAPPAPQTLAELVTAARRQLRGNRLTLDRAAVLRRRSVFEAVREEITR